VDQHQLTRPASLVHGFDMAIKRQPVPAASSTPITEVCSGRRSPRPHRAGPRQNDWVDAGVASLDPFQVELGTTTIHKPDPRGSDTWTNRVLLQSIGPHTKPPSLRGRSMSPRIRSLPRRLLDPGQRSTLETLDV